MSTPGRRHRRRACRCSCGPASEDAHAHASTPGGDRRHRHAPPSARSNFDVTGEVVAGRRRRRRRPPTPASRSPTTCAGKIALVDRGTCTFEQQGRERRRPPAPSASSSPTTPPARRRPASATPIPPRSPSRRSSSRQATATRSRPRSRAGPVTAHAVRSAAALDRDGDDRQHASSRTSGATTSTTASPTAARSQCGAMSEGWGDFIALLHGRSREGDNLDGAFAAGIYATAHRRTAAYFGIRRFAVLGRHHARTRSPSSTSPTACALPTTTPHQRRGGPNSEVHNAGEVWATMLFEAYVALSGRPRRRAARFAADNARRHGRLRRAGLQLAPPDATYTETRDAILAAAAAQHARRTCGPVAEAFARRGAGSCAVAPPGARLADLGPGVTETFTVGQRAWPSPRSPSTTRAAELRRRRHPRRRRDRAGRSPGGQPGPQSPWPPPPSP